jgi:cysteinyl-tRNA synthetase
LNDKQALDGGGRPPAHLLVRKCGVYVTKILRVFGVVDGSDDIGFGSDAGGGTGGGAGGGDSSGGGSDGVAAAVSPFVDALVNFRDSVRSLARSKADAGAVLAACDTVRDDTLVGLGVRLEDATQEGGASRWRLEDPDVLRQVCCCVGRAAKQVNLTPRSLSQITDRPLP